jgi:hypothetical protein
MISYGSVALASRERAGGAVRMKRRRSGPAVELRVSAFAGYR